jgi:hypothetical protein
VETVLIDVFVVPEEAREEFLRLGVQIERAEYSRKPY